MPSCSSSVPLKPQSWNTADGILLIPWGIDKEPVMFLHPWNAHTPNLLSFDGNFNSPYKPLHPAKQ